MGHAGMGWKGRGSFVLPRFLLPSVPRWSGGSRRVLVRAHERVGGKMTRAGTRN